MEGDQAGAVFLPGIAQLAQDVGVVMHTGRRLHAQRVEFGRFREQAGHFGEARNHPAAITEYAHRATFPIPFARLVRMLELTHQVNHVILVFGKPLEASHEAWPRSAFELIEHRCVVHFLCHGHSSLWCAAWACDLVCLLN